MISERIPPHGWGGQISTYQDIISLSENDFRVTLITNKFAGEKDLEKINKNITIVRIPLSQSAVKKVCVLGHFGTYLSYKMMRYDNKKIAKIIKVKKPDLVHIQDLEIGTSGLKQYQRIPIIATIRSCWPICPNESLFNGKNYCYNCTTEKMLKCQFFSNKEIQTNYKLMHHALYNSLLLPFNVYILKKILVNRQKDLFYNTDNIITISKYLKYMLQKNYNLSTGKIHTIYPSLPNFPYVPPRMEDEKIIFTFIGRFSFSKGLINLLKAFKEALRRNRHIQLRIFGSGPLDWYVKKYIRQARLYPFISNEGSFPYDFFPRIMKDTDVVIMPSLAPEGFGRVAMEAMACGRAVFINPIGGLVEQVKEGLNGFYVNCNDLTIFSNRILEVADTPREKLVNMGLQAREYVLKNFDKNTNTRNLIALYKKTVVN